MKLSRKLISITLAIVIALSCFSVCAFAALSYTDRLGRLNFTAGTASEVDDYIANVNNPGSYTSLSITGIPGVDFQAALQRLSNLTSITFDDCEITDISWLAYGGNLQTVNLPNNKIWDLTPITSAYVIKDLNLDNNLITNLVPLFSDKDHIYTHISLKNNFISDPSGIVSSRFDGSTNPYLHLNYNFIKDFNSYFSGTILQGHVQGNNTQKPIPDDPFVAIVENGISKIVGYFDDPSVKEVVVGTNAYTSKTNTGLATGQITNSTQIAEKAFANNVNVESWYISDNINYIDSFAFSSCTSLRRVRLSNSMTTLKKQTFYACINLLGVCIPNNVTTVETKAFDLCKRLKYVEFSNKDTSVNNSTFYRCNGDYLTIYVSSGIAESVWQTSTLKSSLDNLLYVSNFTLDRNLAFSNGTLTNASLNGTTFRVPAGLDKIQIISAISCGLNGLSKFLMPEGVSEAQISFTGTTENDIEMLVPQTLTDITDISFANVSFLTNPDTQETSKVIAYTYGNTSVTNTNCTINTDYEIAYDVLEKCLKTLTSNTYLTLPNLGYDIIGSFAFYGIDSDTQTYNSLGNYMKSVTLPNGIVKINTCAFKRLKLMETVTLNNDGMLKEIGEGAFCYCLYLNNVIIPASVEKIGGEAFCYCTRLTNITFNLTNISTNTSDLTEIGDGAFRNCTQLGTISLPSSVTTLGPRVFKNDTDLETINFGINSSLTSIGQEIFANCISLNNNDSLASDVFAIPSGVKLIPMHAFEMPYGTTGDSNNSFDTIVLSPYIDKLIQGSDIALIDENTCGLVDGAFENFYASGRTIVLTCAINEDNYYDVLILIDYLEGLGFTVDPSYDEVVDLYDFTNSNNYFGFNQSNIINNSESIEDESSLINNEFDSSLMIMDYLNCNDDFSIDIDELSHQIALAESIFYSSQI